MAFIILKQIIIMFLYMLGGYGFFRWGKLTREGSRDIAALLINLVLPVVIIKSFCVERTTERLAALGSSALAAVLALGVSILLARLLYKKAPIENFASAFSNAGFIGIPLVSSVLGAGAVFYLVPFVALLNLLQWTYGVAIMTGDFGKLKPKAILMNAFMLSTLLGLALFLTGLGAKLPDVVSGAMNGIAALNSPLAMIVLGVYLAQADLLKMMKNRRLYVCSAVRLLLIPTVTVLVLALLPLSPEIRQTVLIAAAAPVGANVAIYAQLHGQNYTYACETVVMSTLLSIATIPLLFSLAQFICKDQRDCPMLAIIGLCIIAVMLALIMTKKLQTLLALILVPVVGCLIAGFSGWIPMAEGTAFSVSTMGNYITSGMKSIAPTGVMFIFAILFFGLMSDSGAFDPIISGILKIVGMNPVRITIGTLILASLVHLDGSGAATFLIVIPAMLPLYKRVGMRATTLATMTALGAGIMNMLPWGGPTIRAISALNSTVGEVFSPMLIPMACGYATALAIAVYLGRKERGHGVQAQAADLSVQSNEISEEKKALLRPKLFVVNILLIVAAIVLLVSSILPPAVIFMLATAIALLINYPDLDTQKEVVDLHAKEALMMASMLFAAGSFIGIMQNSGMLSAMAQAITSLIPSSAGKFIPLITGIFGVPLSLVFDPDSFYYGVLPVLSEAVGQMGFDPVAVARGAIAGQMTLGFPISPLTGATFLLTGLAGIDLSDHQKASFKWLWLVSLVIAGTAFLLGRLA